MLEERQTTPDTFHLTVSYTLLTRTDAMTESRLEVKGGRVFKWLHGIIFDLHLVGHCW
jgi:hypothetical protein